MKVPNEITAYVIDLIMSPLDSPDDHFIRAEWMGYFATEDLAEKAAKEAFGEHKTIVFNWEVYPLVLTIHGGDKEDS